MSDIFEEVEEQLRSERYVQLFKKYWKWVAGAALAVLLAALAYWGYDTWRLREAAKASEVYSAALETLGKGDAAGAFVAFESVTHSSSKGYKALALLQQGGIRLEQKKTEEAIALFDKAASAAPDPVIGDMARLKSAFALIDTAPYGPLEQRLKPLTDAKRPYHVAAREALAMAKLKAGRMQEARGDFVVLSLSTEAPQPVRERAQLAIAAIDSGAAASLPAAVKAALAAPPPPPLPALPNQLPQSGAGQ